jgi:hypothetical protein
MWLRKWWQGEYVVPDNSPFAPAVVLNPRYERHWTSRVAHAFCDFAVAYWYWIITILIAALSAFIALAE